jgi:predicted RecB family nuclease
MGKMGMITDETFDAHLRCGRKAFLKVTGALGEQHDIERIRTDLDRAYSRRALESYLARYSEGDIVRSPPLLEAAVEAGPRIIVDATATVGNVQSRVRLMERVEYQGEKAVAAYAPVMFVRNDKITQQDKLLLAFQAHALTTVLGALPAEARIVHGEERRILKVKIEPLVGNVRCLIDQIEADLGRDSPPTLTLKGHCNECEFRAACRGVAEATDDLSLLRGLSGKEVEKLRGRGIVTVAQLSHTYRPGRRGKRSAGRARKHDPALQALALRERKVFVLDRPMMTASRVALYLDVEGVPDRDFYYLIGLLAVEEGRCTSYSFWANDSAQQKAIWRACAEVVEGFGDYTVYHYGRYEQGFLDRMRRSADEDEAAVIDHIRSRSCNVLSAIYSHFYFPTHTNSLKDIGRLLGLGWSTASASGIQSLAWRLNWESSRADALKQQLLTYNREDCQALRRVTEFVLSACNDNLTTAEGDPPVASIDEIRQGGRFTFGKTAFFCPELDYINTCAYADYQREKVYLRTSPAVRKSLQRRQRTAKRRLKVDREIDCGPPDACPECGGIRPYVWTHRVTRKVIPDLKFTRSGVRRWVVRYSSWHYRCRECKKTFLADGYRAARAQWGNTLSNWVVYNHVALRQSYRAISLNISELFDLTISKTLLTRITLLAAERYKETYARLKDMLRRGSLVHADETRVTVRNGTGYVWAFTNLEEVVYAYTPTREGDILEDMLDGFTGVLVSDFYAAYDSAKCPQQKCLIHLIRDINNDVFRCPFDEELKQLAQHLVAVLKPIIDTVDKFGLTHRHLNKHKDEVARYFRWLAARDYESESARKYRKRMMKYQTKLFEFLDYDGIPWNNNNAEHAIKEFASRRKIIGGASTERGLQDYLIFLSVYQTCRLKHLNFLRFLRSGAFDIDAFADGAGR